MSATQHSCSYLFKKGNKKGSLCGARLASEEAIQSGLCAACRRKVGSKQPTTTINNEQQPPQVLRTPPRDERQLLEIMREEDFAYADDSQSNFDGEELEIKVDPPTKETINNLNGGATVDDYLLTTPEEQQQEEQSIGSDRREGGFGPKKSSVLIINRGVMACCSTMESSGYFDGLYDDIAKDPGFHSLLKEFIEENNLAQELDNMSASSKLLCLVGMISLNNYNKTIAKKQNSVCEQPLTNTVDASSSRPQRPPGDDFFTDRPKINNDLI